MLLSFRVSNFRSIRDEQEFSFVRSSSVAPAGDEVASGDDQRAWDPRVGTVAGFYGANASGKSNVLKALTFMRSMILNSHTNWQSSSRIPVDTFSLDASHKHEPSLFEAVFALGKTRYQYGFRVTSSEVVGEWLYAYATNRRQIWFERDISSHENYYFGKNFTGRNRVIADLVRPNSLFLSTAVANNHRQAAAAEHWFSVHLRSLSPDDRPQRIEFTTGLSRTEERWKQVTELMQFADLGICNARVRTEVLPERDRERLVRILRATAETEDGRRNQRIQELVDRSSRIVEFGHSTGAGSDPVYLPLTDESLGTQAWFSLVGPVLCAIGSGETLLVDELDASLHPQLTSEVLKIFREPSKNPKQAQILFTTHDTTLLGTMLGERELRRDQVWFTEKCTDGATVIYPLTDFAPRKSENLERGYLQGRYGAVPFLDENVLNSILEQGASTRIHVADHDSEIDSVASGNDDGAP